MANRPTEFGMSGEISSKMIAKYSEEDELEVVAWIERITSESPSGRGREAFHAWLKDGLVLCELMNKLSPGSCKPNNVSGIRFEAMKRSKEMENIAMFLSAARKFGVEPNNLFQTTDLYESQNLDQVQVTLFELSAAARKKGVNLPQIGVKIAETNVREFDEQKTREDRNVIGLQMGTNQVDSQEGMTPYGMGRQLTNKPE